MEKDDVNNILNIIKDCVRFNRFTIELNDNRKENQSFIDNYQIDTKVLKDIVLKTNVEDYEKTALDYKDGKTKLFIFGPKYELENKMITIYTKYKLIQIDDLHYTIIISFHKANFEMKYMFKK